jgi:hypothetical protein
MLKCNNKLLSLLLFLKNAKTKKNQIFLKKKNKRLKGDRNPQHSAYKFIRFLFYFLFLCGRYGIEIKKKCLKKSKITNKINKI